MTDITAVSQNKIYPIIPIRDGVVFPATENVLTFGRPRSVSAVESAFAKDRLAVIVMQKNPNINEPTPNDLHKIGTLIHIDRKLTTDNEINALVRGLQRVEVVNYTSLDPFFVAEVIDAPDEAEQNDEITALCNHITSELRKAVNLGKSIDFLAFMNIMSGVSPSDLANQVSSVLNIKASEKQELLEMRHIHRRLDKVVEYLAHEIKVLEIERKIASKTQEKFDKNVREAVLRERLSAIEKELGDGENKETKDMLVKIKNAKMPFDVEEKAKKELKRLGQMSSYNPEASYLRTYLECLVELPWAVESSSNVDIKAAEKILNKDHYGLKKIKERIIEYLAVMQLKTQSVLDAKTTPEPIQNQKQAEGTGPDGDSGEKKKRSYAPTILCFVGPPGVGKTSIGKSIARALGRKFVKMSLGGIRDEAEIRGHRRTYVGALPGRIIQGVKQAGTKNPVFMLDEIDKVGNDFRGDPSAALLEALDPEQNYAFSDHYLEVAFDLSSVFFITTCNILDTIPPALRDRLEIIHFPGYTQDEKFHIARDFLVGKQREAHGLTELQVDLTDNAVHTMIERYTREAGVRNLEREIATVFRKAARQVVEGNKKKIAVGVSELPKYLGPYKFSSYLAEKKDEIGMSTGLAWTEAGGDILFIEVALMPGKGALTLTGQLGDVMKESCQAALSYVRTRSKTLGLPDNFYQKKDIHVHVPEGAVPKDGPSAGIAITTALVSALTKIAVRSTVGMTGEVTLRGRVLEIGGVKEKIIAAHRAGIKTVILPKANKKDLEDIPQYVLADLKFVYVDHMDDVLKYALSQPVETEKEESVVPAALHQPLTLGLPS
ncbi:endopeptidase La [Candidatus Woesebacteria bacterium]|nr:endopeptidase La [Candidatus Woesebacteria bacterium]